MITDIIFDLDGTLIDSADSVLLCMAAAMDAHGVNPVIPLNKSLIGPPLREMLGKVTGCKDQAIVEELAKTFMEHYDRVGYQETHVFKGVDTMLHELKAEGLRLHIATNKRYLPTRLIASHMHWSELFTTMYAIDSRAPAFVNKGEMLAAQLYDQNIIAAEAIYIGDRNEDLNAAITNGLHFIAATWGYIDEQLISSPSSYRARSPADISCFINIICTNHFQQNLHS